MQEQVHLLWENVCLRKVKPVGQRLIQSRRLCIDTRKARTLGSKGTTTFYFINDGIESALEKARQSAKGKDIRIQGGANTIQQFLNAGLVDEFFIHIAPVFLGSGIRLFDGIDKDKYDIQIEEVIPSDLTTHLRYKLTKKLKTMTANKKFAQ
jgi:dihydrofolate reductase